MYGESRFGPAKVLKRVEESWSRYKSKGIQEDNELAPKRILEPNNDTKRPRVVRSGAEQRGGEWTRTRIIIE